MVEKTISWLEILVSKIWPFETSKTIAVGHLAGVFITLPTWLGWAGQLMGTEVDTTQVQQQAEQLLTIGQQILELVKEFWAIGTALVMGTIWPLVIVARTIKPGDIARNAVGLFLGKRA